MTRPIRIGIDRVVVPAHLAGDRAAIEAAIRAEIARRMTDPGAAPVQSWAAEAVDGGTVAGGVGSAESIGTRIGAAVVAGVRR